MRPKTLGLGSATSLVAANMIGVGVFTTSGYALADLGSPGWVLLAWLVGGVIACCGGLAYTALACALPRNGGEYQFLSRAIHPMAGFLAGWVSLFAGFTAPVAIAAHGFEAYTRAVLPLAWPEGALGSSAIVLCGLLHGVRGDWGLRIQNMAVAVKLSAMLAFVVVGSGVLTSSRGRLAEQAPLSVEALKAAVASPAVVEPTLLGTGSFAVTLVWISFAYSGWNAAVYLVEEIDQPHRTLPLATGLGTLGVVGLYLALNAIFLFSAPVAELAGRTEIGAVAAEAIGGPALRQALSAVVALGLWTSISAMTLVGPRVYAQMAEDGRFPRSLRATAALPRRAIALQVGLAVAAFWIAELRELMVYAGFMLGGSALGAASCVFLSPFRRACFGLPEAGALVFVLATGGGVGFTLWREPREAVLGLGTVLIGVVPYLYFERRRSAAESG